MRKILVTSLLLLLCSLGQAAVGPIATHIPKVLNTLNDLIVPNPTDLNTNVIVLGADLVSDGRGGIYQWIANDFTPTNASRSVVGSTFTPNGRWFKRSFFGVDPGTTVAVPNISVLTVPDIATLKSLTVSNDIGMVNVRGYFNAGDGWGGQFWYDAAGTDFADEGIIVAPNNGPGIWRRIQFSAFTGALAGWWGGITNSTIGFAQTYIASIGGGTVVLSPPGQYQLGEPISLIDNITLQADTGTLIYGDNTFSNIVTIDTHTNIAVIGLSLTGGTNGIWIRDSSDLTFRDNLLNNVQAGFAVDDIAAGSTNLSFTLNRFYNVSTNYHNLPATANSGNGVLVIDVNTTFGSLNPTDGRLPYRSGASFGDSPLGFVSTNRLYFGHKTNSLFYTDGTNSLGVGKDSLQAVTTGAHDNTAVGALAGAAVTTGQGNTFLGYTAGNLNTSGSDNTLLGAATGRLITTGGNNTFVGANAGALETSGTDSTGVGLGALAAMTTGFGNSALGAAALQALTTASEDTAVGDNALPLLTTGTHTIGIGYQSGSNATTASYTILIGDSAGDHITTASGNTLLGYNAGSTLTTGSSNVVIGALSDTLTSTTAKAVVAGINVKGASQTVSLGLNITNNGGSGSGAVGDFLYNTGGGGFLGGISLINTGDFVTMLGAGGVTNTVSDVTIIFQPIMTTATYNPGAGVAFSAGVETVFWSQEEDLTVPFTEEYNVPAGTHFFVDEMGIIVTSANTVTVQPHISFGNQADSTAGLLADVQTTGLTAAFKRQRFTTPVTVDGNTDMKWVVGTAATATSMKARAYIKGHLLQNQ